MMRVTLTIRPGYEDWCGVKERALVTVGKHMVNAPTLEWKRAILRAKHSPIRWLRFSFRLEGIPSYVATHLARHVHSQPYIMSQRNDRQDNYDRNSAPQSAPVDMILDANAEALMAIASKRLCRQADPTTREIVRQMVDQVYGSCPEFRGLLAPPCEIYGRCMEMYPCGRSDHEVSTGGN